MYLCVQMCKVNVTAEGIWELLTAKTEQRCPPITSTRGQCSLERQTPWLDNKELHGNLDVMHLMSQTQDSLHRWRDWQSPRTERDGAGDKWNNRSCVYNSTTIIHTPQDLPWMPPRHAAEWRSQSRLRHNGKSVGRWKRRAHTRLFWKEAGAEILHIRAERLVRTSACCV